MPATGAELTPELCCSAAASTGVHDFDEAPLKTLHTKPTERGSSHPGPLSIPSMPLPARLRVGHLMWLLSKGHSTIYRNIAQGSIPKPDGYDGRPYWLAETVQALMAERRPSPARLRPRKPVGGIGRTRP